MSFEVRQEGAFIDIYNKEKDLVLARVPAIESESGKDEFYILDGDWSPISYDNSDEVQIPTPYFDVEQALDDFEYVTETIPSEIIKDFKEKINKSNTLINSRKVSETMRKTKTSDRSELFFLNRDGGFFSLLHAPTGYQLNFSPASETASGDDEFSITTEDFEPIENYEVLAKTFTNDFSEALSEFEGIVGNVPQSVIKDFVNKSFMEMSARHTVYEDNDPRLENGVVVIDEDGKVLSYLSRFRYDFLDTVDEPDGGFSKAVIFKDEEQARNASSSFEAVYDNEGNLISRHEWEVIPVSQAFNFVNTSAKIADMDDFEVIRDGNFVDVFNTKDQIVLSYMPPEETASGEAEFSIVDTNYEPIRKFEKFANGVLDFEQAWQAFDALSYVRLPEALKTKFQSEIGIDTVTSDSLVESIGEDFYIYRPTDTSAPYQITFDKDTKEVSVEYFDEEHGDEDVKVFSISDYSIYDFLREIYPSADIDELEKALDTFNHIDD